MATDDTPVTGKDAFIAQLKEFYRECGEPPYEALAVISGKLAHWYPPVTRDKCRYATLSKSGISEPLTGKRKTMPPWPWVASFILCCQRWAAETGAAPSDPGISTLPAWAKIWAAHAGQPAAQPSQPASRPASGPARPESPPPGTSETPRHQSRLSPAQQAFIEDHGSYGSHLLRQAGTGDPDAIYRLALLLSTDPAHHSAALALLIDAVAAEHGPATDLLDANPHRLPIFEAARHAHDLAQTAKADGRYAEASALYQAAARGGARSTATETSRQPAASRTRPAQTRTSPGPSRF